MKKINFLIIALLLSLACHSQTSCVQHWSKNKIACTDLDSILAAIDKQQFDTFYCDSFTMHTKLNTKWYINFYNKQIGNYVSNPDRISLSVFYFKDKMEGYRNEMNIIQFMLDEKYVKRFVHKYGLISDKKSIFKIEAYTAYKYLVKGNSVYFICTRSYKLANQQPSFFDEMVDVISKRYK